MILTTIGTDGDVFPYIALGEVLRSRGHRVTLVAGEEYGDLARGKGLEFAELISREEGEAMFSNPDFWHPIKAPIVGARMGVEWLARHYELLCGLARQGESVLVASPGVLAARVVQEKLRRPMASVILQPWMIRSSIAPPVMPAGMTLPRWAPSIAKKGYWRMLDFVGEMLFGKELNALRRRIGLASVKRMFSWWISPELVIGMFPEWYGRFQADWAPQVRLVGFPVGDVKGGGRLEPGLEEFIEGSGFRVQGSGTAGCERVVAFTFGTGFRQAGRIFAAAVEACERLGVRGILLTKFAEQVPARLPSCVRHVSYAPFGALFPRCAAVVHHGGVGTMAKAFAAGVPQLVLPVAYDQKDNAIRVEGLGCGTWVRARSANGARVAEGLNRIMNEDVSARCREVARNFGAGDALERAAGLVEALTLEGTDRSREPLAPAGQI